MAPSSKPASVPASNVSSTGNPSPSTFYLQPSSNPFFRQLGVPEGGASISGCEPFTLGGTGRQTLNINSRGFPNCQIDVDTTPACRDFRIAGVRNCGNSRSFQFGAPGELRVCNP